MKSTIAVSAGLLLTLVSDSVVSDSTMIWVQCLGWALVHSVWQIAALALVALLGIRCLAARSANARYVAGVVSLSLMVTMPVATFVWYTQRDIQHAYRSATINPVAASVKSAVEYRGNGKAVESGRLVASRSFVVPESGADIRGEARDRRF